MQIQSDHLHHIGSAISKAINIEIKLIDGKRTLRIQYRIIIYWFITVQCLIMKNLHCVVTLWTSFWMIWVIIKIIGCKPTAFESTPNSCEDTKLCINASFLEIHQKTNFTPVIERNDIIKIMKVLEKNKWSKKGFGDQLSRWHLWDYAIYEVVITICVWSASLVSIYDVRWSASAGIKKTSSNIKS